MGDKETSSRVSQIASRLMHISPATILQAQDRGENALGALCDEIQALAGSALSQDKTPGHARYLIQARPKISITDKGPHRIINVDYGNTTFHAHFSAGNDEAQTAAISSLTEKICGFSTFEIIKALHDHQGE